MTSPASASSHLWPSLDALKGYLDMWAKYAYDLEAQVRTQEAMYSHQVESQTADIARLTIELAESGEPLQARIVELEQQLRGLEQENRVLVADREDSVRRLAKLLEVAPGSTTTLQDLVGQAMTLVDHTKAMFRERL